MAKLMPKDAAARLTANDPTLTSVSFVNHSVFQMKSAEYAQLIAEGIRNNTHCKELIIDKCNLMDPGAVSIAEALKHNKTCERLMLPNNKLGPLSLSAIAECLKVNNTITEFGLLGNSGSSGGKWGDASLTLLIEALEGPPGNTSLTKIVWRLDNRLSWKITKMMSRNVEIKRRRAAGMDVSDMDPRMKKDGDVQPSGAAAEEQKGDYFAEQKSPCPHKKEEAPKEEEKEIEPVKPPTLDYNGNEYMLTPDQEAFMVKFKASVPSGAYNDLLGGLVNSFLKGAKI
uniref:Uncharacterized protein n=1 Tax=Paramoeba aestuarina TaxID=180227 RepID=A0A7S4KCZ4_9EUKA|eukprot:CAMPEP_0201517116 /NCGR_PEP_ID=MMETSP0161_2-20130828/8306_1 /ASSEMBLY_ACC=CAM_ASM_000251 /TAXON_ID=180227 /ORGANISM="Neoparamoeba aestuarina, Strain SoJaBio B1-5/56/2" /LENGTH=284 /DNA_ID=CAMNT_0047914527 /DNA_START=39 /DNA_END=893 /DNA_ORIENTATION=+